MEPLCYTGCMKKLDPDYFKNIIFGFSDAFVSSVGVLVGIATATRDAHLIFLTGIIVIGVEAMSMGAGAFLSEKASHQLSKGKDGKDNPKIDGLFMFISYFLGGFVPLIPYIMFPLPHAIWVSIGATFAALFILGFIKGKLVKVSPWKSAAEMFLVAGAAIVIGFVLGQLVDSLR